MIEQCDILDVWCNEYLDVFSINDKDSALGWLFVWILGG